jgi:hypothetical protein
MKAENMNQLLLRRFPGLLPEYLEAKKLWGGEEPGPHVVYGDVFVGALRNVLDGGSSGELEPFMAFLEDLSSSADSAVLDVVVTSVLEALLDEPKRASLESAMGERTRRLWKRLVADTS